MEVARLIRIDWLEAVRIPEASYVEVMNARPIPRATIGYLLMETEDFLTLASSQENTDEKVTDDRCEGVFCIPKISILGVFELIQSEPTVELEPNTKKGKSDGKIISESKA